MSIMKRLACTLLAAVLLVSLFPLSAILLPPVYDETFTAELPAKVEILKNGENASRRIILLGGSGVVFGADSGLIEENLTDCEVVNFGMYAALGTEVMLELCAPHLHEGDVVVIMPELSEQTLSDYFHPELYSQALEGRDGEFWSLLAPLNSDYQTMLLGHSFSFLTRKASLLISDDKPTGSGIYRRSAFNERGDLDEAVMEAEASHNIMPGGVDESAMINLENLEPTDEFIEAVQAFAEKAEGAGAAVYFHLPPVNEAAIVAEAAETAEAAEAAGAESAAVKKRAVTKWCLEFSEESGLEILGEPGESLMASGWFYDTNFHPNAEGRKLFSALLIEELRDLLGDKKTSSVDVAGEAPALNESVTGNLSSEDAIYFVYEIENETAILTGLTEEGKRQEKLEIPATVTLSDGAENSTSGQSTTLIPVTRLAAGALEGATVNELYVQDMTLTLEDGCLDGAKNLEAVHLASENPGNYLVGYDLLRGTGARVKVAAEAYTEYLTDYRWSVYTDRIDQE